VSAISGTEIMTNAHFATFLLHGTYMQHKSPSEMYVMHQCFEKAFEFQYTQFNFLSLFNDVGMRHYDAYRCALTKNALIECICLTRMALNLIGYVGRESKS
jgi:hypothetical protein